MSSFERHGLAMLVEEGIDLVELKSRLEKLASLYKDTLMRVFRTQIEEYSALKLSVGQFESACRTLPKGVRQQKKVAFTFY